MKVNYKTIEYLKYDNAKPNDYDDEMRLNLAYELLKEALKLVPEGDTNEYIASIYMATREEIESAIEGISDEVFYVG